MFTIVFILYFAPSNYCFLSFSSTVYDNWTSHCYRSCGRSTNPFRTFVKYCRIRTKRSCPPCHHLSRYRLEMTKKLTSSFLRHQFDYDPHLPLLHLIEKPAIAHQQIPVNMELCKCKYQRYPFFLNIVTVLLIFHNIHSKKYTINKLLCQA